MQTISELALRHTHRGYFTREQAAVWAGDRGARLDGLLKRAVASGETQRISRGLYALDNQLSGRTVDPLELAQLIYGPSYLSLEFVLSDAGWIPEAVYAVTSVSTKRSQLFDTPAGYFSYTRVPQRLFFAGVRRHETSSGGSFFMATPLKALADWVYSRKIDERPRAVFESLRIDARVLTRVDPAELEEVASAYKPGRVSRFLKALGEDITG